MIGVKIKCGLGNQLFQYAAGRALAEKFATELHCYTDFYDQSGIKKHEQFILPRFVPKMIKRTGFPAELPLSQKITNRLPYFRNVNLYKTNSLAYESSFQKLSKTTYLDGWFTSFKYFDTFSSLIKRELQLPEELIENSPWENLARNENSIGIHVRRGDYVVPPHNRCYYELTPNYYHAAINYIAKNKNNQCTSILIFSDDISWCKANLHIPQASFVEHTGTDAVLKDFELLSRCNHQIISNSTFAWWAAYLSKRPNSRVIAPRTYYRKDNRLQTADRYPRDWIVL
jgi:hypothetical protein